VSQKDPICIGGNLQLVLIRMPEVSGIARCGHCEASGAQHGCEHHGDVLVAVERCWAIRHPDARVGARGRPGPDFCL